MQEEKEWYEKIKAEANKLSNYMGPIDRRINNINDNASKLMPRFENTTKSIKYSLRSMKKEVRT